MSVIQDLYEALSIFSVPIVVHPSLNVLEGGKVNGLNEVVPITGDDLAADNSAEKLSDPVVPRSSNITASLTQSLSGGGNTVPRQYAWYSEHSYEAGTLVECMSHVFQIDQIADYDHVAGIYVYYLKGDDALEPVRQ